MASLTLHRHRDPRSGFTFMEILFAVMILGIGFIMVAAMFPAALRQTQANVEENEFNAVARLAAKHFDSLALNTDPRWGAYAAGLQQNGTTVTGSPQRVLDLLTGWLINDNGGATPLEYDPGSATLNNRWGRPVPWSFHDERFSPEGAWGGIANVPRLGNPNPADADPTMDPYTSLWDTVRGNMIIPDRRQNAWVALWARSRRVVSGKEIMAPTVQLFIFPVHSRAKPEYDANATIPGSSPAAPNPACDITYRSANLDPALITFHYFPPPKANPNPNAPNGVFELYEVCSGKGGSAPIAVSANGNALSPAAFPIAEGSLVVVSDDKHNTIAPMPAKYNGMIFKLANEVSNQAGDSGNSNGRFWAVGDITNLPSEQPFNIATPADIEQNAFSSQGPGSAVHALVVGRQIDPSDPSQQNDSVHKAMPQQNQLPNRTGLTQELGYYPWSVVVQQ